MKDISTPVPPNEVRAVIKKSLENAALVNYERLSEEARIEGIIILLSAPPYHHVSSRAGQSAPGGCDRGGGGAPRQEASGPHQAGRAVCGPAQAE